MEGDLRCRVAYACLQSKRLKMLLYSYEREFEIKEVSKLVLTASGAAQERVHRIYLLIS